MLYDTEKNKMSQKATCFVSAINQVSKSDGPDCRKSLNLITKDSWLKLSKENLVYGFTLQNTSKL